LLWLMYYCEDAFKSAMFGLWKAPADHDMWVRR